ncbi:Uncharacterised protein [Mycobacteroides abscessus subsp. abscessus]|uniref:hypothetical protein n=1 Tax=Mycobacteroides abscessus TaxID=36809 RepID=UPI000927096D|nr:hypothetical protein [Mycobacteroides abscessus]SHT13830.1 Uncharacterised protein [Mycobacteroides abscessus subsp. abscessus]SKO59991.1 Uncharacterised protein [Mycobacteroides abscessus subsp. abscessus]
MNVLNPTEAQRKAMGEAADEWQGRVDTTDEYIDRIIAAANSIPEGAPVGTIARRPDGGWVAHRTVGLDAPFWEYFQLNPNAPARKNQYDADSWPQIRPDEWPEQVGLDWFPPGEEPIVPRPDPTAQQEPERTAEDVGGEIRQHWEERRPKPYREPRVVDRLGVDEQGSRWRNCAGLEFWHDGTRWVSGGLGGDLYGDAYEPDALPPYTEILEPRVLPSLDCEEARDGTVWSPVDDLVGRRYRFGSGSWKSKVGDEEWYTLRSIGLLEERFGPFTEVIE